jgi:zinc transport system ATP-binding protein
MSVIEVREASFGYGAEPIVEDATVTVERGTLTVVLGENGSGKSTLVKGMLELIPLLSGSLQLFGHEATIADRRRIGYVPQRTTVAGGIPVTVRELVTSGRTASRRPFAPLRASERAAVDAALDAVRLRDRAHDPVSALSGGQQRRALIARALAGQPELLVMDEPMAGVDATNVELLAGAMVDWKQSGMTLVVVAHGAGPLRPLVDHAVVMRRGRVGYEGPLTDELDAEYADHILEDHRDVPGRIGRVPEEPHLAPSSRREP